MVSGISSKYGSCSFESQHQSKFECQDDALTLNEEETTLLDSDSNILQRRNYEKRKNLIRGMTFALFSGASYTGSNFIIKRFKADASDVTLIRFIHSPSCFARKCLGIQKSV